MLPTAESIHVPPSIRAYLNKLIATPDIGYTGQTGAPGMNYGWHPVSVYAEEYGMCREIAEALDSYRRWQVGRPRHWRDEQGIPYGLRPNPPKFTGDTNLINLCGRNAYDVQHFDVEELLIGHRLLRWPMFLDQLINIWTHAYRTQYYWRTVEDQTYAGSMRCPAGLLIATKGMTEAFMVDGQPMPGYKALWDMAHDFLAWHEVHLETSWPIISPWYYGSSAGLGWFKENHIDYHYSSQNAQLCCALARVSEMDMARKVAGWLADRAFDPVSKAVYEITDGPGDKTHSVPAGMPGTGMHLAPALIMADHDCALRDHLRDKFGAWGWLNPESQYGISMAYPWVTGW